MRNGVVLFSSDRGITPAELARAAEERGFDTIYVPEHTHIPVRRDAAHPTGGEDLPDDRYLRTLDPWVSLATAAAVTSRIRLVHRGRAAGGVRPDHARQDDRHPRPPLRRPGHDRRRLRLEHRRARGPPRPGREAPHRAPRVRRGDARAVDRGGGGVRRGVRVVQAVLGLPQAGAGAHPADHRGRRRPEDVRVDRAHRRRLDDDPASSRTSPARPTHCARRGRTPAARAAPTSTS